MGFKIGVKLPGLPKFSKPSEILNPIKAIKPEVKGVTGLLSESLVQGKGGLLAVSTKPTTISDCISGMIEGVGQWYDDIKSANGLGPINNAVQAGDDLQGRISKQIRNITRASALKLLIGSKILKGALKGSAKVFDGVTGALEVCRSYSKERAAGKNLLSDTMLQISSTVLQTSVASIAGGVAMTGATAAGLGIALPVTAGTAAFIGAGYLCGRVLKAAKETIKGAA